ncbi:DUF2968 domain-containing protein [Glaciimonas soli]|uniref:DUF2968 domain-containing protein n=1 Tax=Glaciimonas soli TaxID=2590999 RepID=A0A843YUL6_9BURK|nr:DUF2968 domain-containing protein [Glaciimonas soli]MQR01394.1 DUF2968 domain-containing protein [Glaciimonas soli]
MKVTVRKVVCCVGVGMFIAGMSVNALAQSSTASPAPAIAVTPQSATAATKSAPKSTISTNSTISELQQLMPNGVSEMRTTYNGSYGASLLFKPDTRTYYVALFQQKNFWRVVKTASDTQAEQVYKSFVGQTEKLADVELRSLKLEADKQYTEQQIAMQETRLNALQNDVALQQQQEQSVLAQQDQGRQQAQLLSNKQQAASSELRSLQSRIRALESQQVTLNNSNLGDTNTTKK